MKNVHRLRIKLPEDMSEDHMIECRSFATAITEIVLNFCEDQDLGPSGLSAPLVMIVTAAIHARTAIDGMTAEEVMVMTDKTLSDIRKSIIDSIPDAPSGESPWTRRSASTH